ncbi:TOBE domain-containing protein [Xylophilus sp.]|uniref:TOBE domain-containing protein n=1 Tax=Xylophilus sp. TaxID=2653893 RepID=UPI0013BE6477|nr:TOBE domain-containing protein [Xylophilus sp.]KAF1048237.1 MAG: Molybdenum-pterin-binding protein MopA [Xylophilus sp.]
MKASARNQFFGQIAAVHDGSIHDEVELQIASGLRVVATVTRASRTALGLQPGARALALVKASSVVIVTDAAGVRFSARNQFAGTVGQVTRGAVNSEVALALPGGERLVAIVTNESADGLGLAAGQPATALFKAGSVIIGVPA